MQMLDLKPFRGIFGEYPSIYLGYKNFNPATRRITTYVHVVFKEDISSFSKSLTNIPPLDHGLARPFPPPPSQFHIWNRYMTCPLLISECLQRITPTMSRMWLSLSRSSSPHTATGVLIRTRPTSSKSLLLPTSPLSLPVGQLAQHQIRWHRCLRRNARNPPPTQTHALAPTLQKGLPPCNMSLTHSSTMAHGNQWTSLRDAES
jgi:hypothetical protein